MASTGTGTAREEEMFRREILQVVTIKPDGSTSPDPFVLNKTAGQQVVWVAEGPEDARFSVEFKGESPFYESHFSDASPYSGMIRRTVIIDSNKKYAYTVRINGITNDPSGIIDR